MAEAVATPTVTFIDHSAGCVHVFGTLAVDADPATYATGGIACDFTGLIPGVATVLKVAVRSQKSWNSPASPTSPYSPNTTEYEYYYTPGGTLANGKLQIFEAAGSAAPLSEIAASATPAVVSNDTIGFEGWFKKGGV